MKKLHKFTKLSLILLAQFIFSLYTTIPSTAKAPSTDFYHVTFIISKGIENDYASTISEGIIARPISPDDYTRTIPIGTTQAEVSYQIFLIYQSAPGYQNAECTVNGIPIASNERFSLSSPTQIVCTAEPIPEPEPTLSVTVPAEVNLSISPTSEGEFGSKSFDIIVTTDNPAGYTLTMYNDSSNLTSTDSSAIIPTLSNEIAKSNFPVNHWGYSLDDNTYKPITTISTGTVLKTTETTSAADTTTINLATKVDLNKPAGTYTNTFVFNVIANELPNHTITWNANGGTVSPTTSSIQYGNPIGTLPTPTYDGYNFLGWFTTADGGAEVTSATIVTGDATYYAHWEEAIKMINFTVDGVSYEAEEGMTWLEWTKSQYNTKPQWGSHSTTYGFLPFTSNDSWSDVFYGYADNDSCLAPISYADIYQMCSANVTYINGIRENVKSYGIITITSGGAYITETHHWMSPE